MKFLLISFITCLIHDSLAQKLGSYNIDKSKITVSGISAGGAMAAQMHVAFSNTIKGAGIVTGRMLKFSIKPYNIFLIYCFLTNSTLYLLWWYFNGCYFMYEYGCIII